LISFDGTNWANIAGAVDHNWLSANNGTNFAIAPLSPGSNSIVLGNNAECSGTSSDDNVVIGTNASGYKGSSVVIGYSAACRSGSVAIGKYATATNTTSVAIGFGAETQVTQASGAVAIGVNSYVASAYGIAIGREAEANYGRCIAIGPNAVVGIASRKSIAIGADTVLADYGQAAMGWQITDANVPSEDYSVRLGHGTTGVNQNILHLRSKGKLELIGDEAQFVLPNYQVGSPPSAIPATTIEGGMIWDALTKETKVYTLATLPTVVEGATIYVSDATGSSLTGSQCFGNVSGSPTVWVDVTTGVAVA